MLFSKDAPQSSSFECDLFDWLTVPQTLKQRQEAELQVQGSSQQLHREKEDLQDKVTSLQSSLQSLQSERTELERVLTRLGKDKASLRKTLEKVSR